MALPKPLKDLLSLPTAAFEESAVMDHILGVCKKLSGVSTQFDRYGNLLTRYRYRPPATPPLVFTAHTDHPGFVALEMLDQRTVRAAFRGWVEPAYFLGTRMRFFSNGCWINGRVLEVTKEARVYAAIGRTARPEEVAVRVAEPVAPRSPGMWHLADPVVRRDTIYARGCDDIAGCAAMMALLERLSRKKAHADTYCLFTRAEEVGFIGAIGAAKARTIPKKSPVIAIETSKALPSARIGEGPILRVGDRASVFTPGVTAFCDRVAKRLAGRRKSFRYQRKLMDGGTCESTAYIAYGYATTGICLALGNYHNMNTEKRKIESEYVSLSDWKQMVDWFEALVLDKNGCGGEGAALREAMEKRFAKYLPLLDPAQPARKSKRRGKRYTDL